MASDRYSLSQMPSRPRKSSLAPRKRPAQRRSTATVDAILEAAARILETRGLDDYTTNDIAERAGVSIGSLYQYFPTKESITRALIEREMAALRDATADLATCNPGPDCLRQLIHAAVRHQLNRPALARLLDAEEARLPISHELEAIRTALMAVVQSCVEAARPGQSCDADPAAKDVAAIIKGMVDEAGQRGEADVELLAERVTRAVFGYLGVAQR
jgi:AcrR family transcriptional regulator